MPSIWAPACQDSSHVGNAGVGVISMRGASIALPTFATAQFQRFFDCGRAVRCMLPLGLGGFMHLVVLYGYQGADTDAEQLALTEHLFDAAQGEHGVVARGQPCLLIGDFNVEPTKIPCLAKGISAGLWVDFGEAWALASGLQPAPTCKRTWTAASGRRRDFILGCPLAAAAILSCRVQPDRWIAPHLAVRALFDYGRWDAWVAQSVRCTLIRLGVLSLLRFRGSGRFTMSGFSSCLGEMLCTWMSPLMLEMFLVRGLCGLVLLRLLLLRLISLVVVPFLVGVLFFAGAVLRFGLSDLVVTGFWLVSGEFGMAVTWFARFVLMLLTHPLLLFLICGVGLSL